MEKKIFVSADFNVASANFDSVLNRARDAVVNVNVLVQEAAYSALYTFVNGYTTQNVQRLFNSLCIVDGSFDNFRYENLRIWMAQFFLKAKEEDLVKGVSLTINKVKNESTGMIEDITADWVYTDNVGDDGKPVKKYPLPNRGGSQIDRANHTKMVELLGVYAAECAVHTAVKDAKVANRAKNSKRDENKALEDANKPQALIDYETAQKNKKACADAVNKVKKSFEKQVQTIVEHGGDMTEMRNMLRNLLAMIEPVQIEGIGDAPQAEESEQAEAEAVTE